MCARRLGLAKDLRESAKYGRLPEDAIRHIELPLTTQRAQIGAAPVDRRLTGQQPGDGALAVLNRAKQVAHVRTIDRELEVIRWIGIREDKAGVAQQFAAVKVRVKTIDLHGVVREHKRC